MYKLYMNICLHVAKVIKTSSCLHLPYSLCDSDFDSGQGSKILSAKGQPNCRLLFQTNRSHTSLVVLGVQMMYVSYLAVMKTCSHIDQIRL